MKNISKMMAKALFDPKWILYRLSEKYINYYEGFSYDFNKNGERLLVDRLKKTNVSVVFDVGANIGEWTNMALQSFISPRVHSFEISEATFKTLKANVKSEKSFLNNYGLSNKVGEITYKDYGDNSELNTILSNAEFHDHRIKPVLKNGKLLTGDFYCVENNISAIDFIKIDVEGAEHLVLEGFEQLLSQAKIGLIQFEYGYSNGDVHFLMKDFFMFFEKYGYIVGSLKPSGVIFSDFKYKLNDFKSGPNFVALHKDNLDLIDLIKAPM